MLIHTIGIVLLIIMLSIVQAIAFKLRLLPSTALRLLVLGTCIVCSSTYMFAIYSQAVLNTTADNIWSLPDDYVSDNKFAATLDSAKFMAKDRLELDVTFEPRTDILYRGSPTPAKQLHLVFMSPDRAYGFARAPMLVLGLLLWIVTFVSGWMLRSTISTDPIEQDRPNSE